MGGRIERRLRLASGLLIAAYIVPHLLNHALGIFSLDAMERMRAAVGTVLYLPGVDEVLLAAFVVHFLLGLWALWRRATLRMPAWEAAQISLGLLVWPLLMTHVVGASLTPRLLGIDITFPMVVGAIWLGGPWMVAKQIALILVVWTHLAIGIHFWLRIRWWYRRVQPILHGLAILIPAMAVTGFVRAGLAVEALATPEWIARTFAARRTGVPPETEALIASLEPILLGVMAALVAAVLAGRAVRAALSHRRGTFRLRLPGGRVVRAPVGLTMLEALRAAGVPHASVCGGRGRCTTCRVGVGRGAEELPAPNPVEAAALARIHASPNVRLACQTRPLGEVDISPLLPSSAGPAEARRPGGVHGREQEVAALFVDLRGSTALASRKMPYDVLFILNQFFAEMAGALAESGGHYAQFNGDGLLALYGLEGDLASGCRDALAGAQAMLARMDALNERLLGEVGEPLKIGIGIHCGEAIVGVMGPPATPILSAIGDTINTAARLEALTKELGAPVVVSRAVAAAAGLQTEGLPVHRRTVRGRDAELEVLAISDPARLPRPAAPRPRRAAPIGAPARAW